MAVIVTPQKEIDEYFNSPALSQSKLKTLLKGYRAFCKPEQETRLYFEENESFILGSAVDCILTGEDGEFDKQYHISEIEKKPSETLMSICNQLIDDAKVNYNREIRGESFFEYVTQEWFDLFSEDRVKIITNIHEYGMKWSAETCQKKVLECEDYIQDQIQSEGKQVLSQAEKTTIDTIVYNLQNSPNTSTLLDRSLYEEGSIDMYLQLPIYFTFMGIKCKALLDLVMVFRNDKGQVTEVHPYDLKTMSGDTTRFLSSIKKFRYDIQAAWYTRALMEYFKVPIHPYSFIVESTTMPGTPLVYQMEESFVKIGEQGLPGVRVREESTEHEYVMTQDVKGIMQLIDDYQWYERYGTEEDKVVRENNGVLIVNWNEIVSSE